MSWLTVVLHSWYSFVDLHGEGAQFNLQRLFLVIATVRSCSKTPFLPILQVAPPFFAAATHAQLCDASLCSGVLKTSPVKPDVFRSLAANTKSTHPHLRFLFEIISARSEMFYRPAFVATRHDTGSRVDVDSNLGETFQDVLVQAHDISHHTEDENQPVVSGGRRDAKKEDITRRTNVTEHWLKCGMKRFARASANMSMDVSCQWLHSVSQM